MGQLFDLEAEGYFYSRLQNPTCDMVAAKICALEGGTAANADVLRAGGKLLCALQHRLERRSYCRARPASTAAHSTSFPSRWRKWAWKRRLSRRTARKRNSKRRSARTRRPSSARRSPNPALTVLDIERFAQAAHRHGVPLVVDNTFATPIILPPDRVGRGHCDAFDDQVHRRPCGGAWRCDRRRWKL